MGFEVIIINLVLAIPTYFVCQLIFKRIKDSRARHLTTWLVTIVLTPVIYIGIILAWIAFATYYPERDFDKEKWKADIEKRYEMTDDLVDNGKLIGKTKEEIKELLGQEDVNSDSTLWTYYIGFKPSIIGIDPDVLEVEFKNDKVSRCWTRGT